jgi:small subunit ribosomal protein S20
MAKLKTGRHTSAIKAQRQALRRALRNRMVHRKARTATKAVLAAASAGDKAKAQSLFPAAASVWDKAAKTGAIHWKTAARRKSRLAVHLSKIPVKA